MKRVVVSCLLLLVSLIHLLPLLGVLGADRLQRLYGLNVTDPSLEILLRHRAVLFGMLGVFLAVSAFRSSYQMAAIVVGLVSVVSFIAITYIVGDSNAAIARVVLVDWWALVGLIVAGLLLALPSR